MLNLIDFAYFQYFLEFSKEKGFLYAVSERPVFKKSIKKGDS